MSIIRRFSNGTGFGNTSQGDSSPDLWHLYYNSNPISTLIDTQGEVIGNPGYINTSKEGIIYGLDRRGEYTSWYDTAWRHSRKTRSNPTVDYYWWSEPSGNILLHRDDGSSYIPRDLKSLLPTFSISDVEVEEGDRAWLTIERSGELNSNVELNIRSRGSSAQPGSPFDYSNYLNSQRESIVFSRGEVTKKIFVDTFKDTVKEGWESFYIDISDNGSNALPLIFEKITGRVDIRDNFTSTESVWITAKTVFARPGAFGGANLYSVDYKAGSIHSSGQIEIDESSLNIANNWGTDIDQNLVQYASDIKIKINGEWKDFGKASAKRPSCRTKPFQYSISEDKNITAFVDESGILNIVSMRSGEKVSLGMYGCDPFVIDNKSILFEVASIPSTSPRSNNWGSIIIDLDFADEFHKKARTPSSDSARTNQVGNTASVTINDTSIEDSTDISTTPVLPTPTIDAQVVINNITINYYESNTTTNINNWNTYSFNYLEAAEGFVSNWYASDSYFQQSTTLTEEKLLDITASSWTGNVLVKSVAQAGKNGGRMEAPQIDDLTTGNQGSVLNGNIASDQIYAKAGWDVIDGESGGDLVRAGNGRDIITGGDGGDELWGDFGWNTFKSEQDGSTDLIVVKSDNNLVNWLYGKSGNSPNGEKADIIEGLDSYDEIRIVGASTQSLTFDYASAHSVSGIGIYADGALECLYTGGDLSISQVTEMTSGDASSAAMNNSIDSYWDW